MDVNVVVMAPHPDDEVLGCGGSILNHRAAGRNVGVVYLTSGEHASPHLPPDELGPLREREADASAAALGMLGGNVQFLRLGDGAIDPYDVGQMGRVVTVLRRWRPQLLYVPHPGEGSFDHRSAFELCWRAAGMAGSANYPTWGGPHWVDTILGYEVWAPIPAPQYGEDITAVIDAKIAALTCYQSQAAPAKGEAQADYVGNSARFLSGYRGAMSVGGHRECFQVLRLGQVIA